MEEEWYSRSPSLNHLWVAIESLTAHIKQRGTELDFIWTPAHIGIEGNEKQTSWPKEAPTPRTNTPFPAQLKKSKSTWKQSIELYSENTIGLTNYLE